MYSIGSMQTETTPKNRKTVGIDDNRPPDHDMSHNNLPSMTNKFSFQNLTSIIFSIFTKSTKSSSSKSPMVLSHDDSDKNNSCDDSQHQVVSSSNRIVCKNINRGLAKDISLSQHFIPSRSHSMSWKAPDIHGLTNSTRIIPEYYFTNHNYHTVFNIDYFHIIIDDIRNLRPLNEHQIEYIYSLDDEHKMDIILEMNQLVTTMNENGLLVSGQ